MNTADELIEYYFLLGLTYSEIIAFLQIRHNIRLSLSTLKRKLKKAGLHRRKYFTDLETVIGFLQTQVDSSSQLHGYRWMHLKCLQHGFVTTQRTVRLILKHLDPAGVEQRSRRRLRRRRYHVEGPNFLWHIDSYDKLKPYGIAINGAIDGFSRKMLWLCAGKTASDPKIIGGYFIKTVEKLNGCPRRIRSDMGTENRHVEQFQMFFRREPVHQNDRFYGEQSYLYGTSQANQRIECWWSMLRKHNSQYWLNIFQALKDDGLYSGTFLDKSLIQFCFLKIVQKELNLFKKEWNSHFIRKSRNFASPYGRPIIMFHLPELYDTVDYLCKIGQNEIAACMNECRFFYGIPCDVTVYELSLIIMEEQNLQMPANAYEAVDLYVILRRHILFDLTTH